MLLEWDSGNLLVVVTKLFASARKSGGQLEAELNLFERMGSLILILLTTWQFVKLQM